MKKYKCIDNYDYPQLEVGKLYFGRELEGIFIDRPFVELYDREGTELVSVTVCHLRRVEEVTGQ